MSKLSQIKMPLDYTEKYLKQIIAEQLNISADKILEIKLTKKSVDARNKSNVHFVLGVDVKVQGETPVKEKNSYREEFAENIKHNMSKRPVIVGSGPAGLFTALTFAEAGMKPIIIERGKEIDRRVTDVETFESTGVLDTESNIQFGEGGAGTFSDGKLTTGIKDGHIGNILKVFYEAGAPEEILYEAKPHIGTDILRSVITRIRKKIINSGGEFRFETKFAEFEAENNILKSITVLKDNKKETIVTDTLILAIGHSARDTIEMLLKSNVKMIQKPFSVGVRIEHKQIFINKSQYGEYYKHPRLGAADYKLSVHLKNNRGIYTFCMCPGGYVSAAASENEMLCVNGMSEYRRDGENANSAVLVGITPEDFKTNDPMEGIEFQRKIEKNAYLYGGGGYKAPVQLADDFLKGIKTTVIEDVEPTYPIGYRMTNLENIFPDFVKDALKEGLFIFNKNIKGFTRNGAVLTGVETRSSSPVRILRNDKMQSSISGIFPCGEGAGYAGGIMSSAVDGVKVAEVILNTMNKGEIYNEIIN